MATEAAPASGRRQQVIATAGELFARDGIASTSMGQVAAAIGIQKPSLYYFFKSKEELVYETLAPAVKIPYQELLAISKSAVGADEKLLQAARSLGDNFDRFPHSMICIVRDRLAKHLEAAAFNEIQSYRRRYTSLWERIVADGVSTGQLKECNRRFVVFGLLGSINWMYAWHDPRGATSAADFAVTWMEAVLAGLRS